MHVSATTRPLISWVIHSRVAASTASPLSLGLQTIEYLYKYYAAYRARD